MPLVALVGRPNVGKSTLFNVFTRTRDALVHDQPGVTRDRQYGVCRDLASQPFAVVDTGGVVQSPEALAQAMTFQAHVAAEEADLLLFVVDARDGAGPNDANILARLRRTGKTIALIINKIDGVSDAVVQAEFALFGIAHVFAVSAVHRHGIEPLLSWIATQLPTPRVQGATPTDAEAIWVACIGRPNVGKSTLTNRVIGTDRVIVSAQAGTTRDVIATVVERDGQRYQWLDTAGVRRRAKTHEPIEKLSVLKTLQAIEQCQVAVLVVDADRPVADQDATILSAVLDAGRALVIAVNKWDCLTTAQRTQCQQQLRLKLGFVPWAQCVMISAQRGSGLGALFAAISRAYSSATKPIRTTELNQALAIAYANHPPPAHHGRIAKLRYIHAAGQSPPTWVVHGTRLSTLPIAYQRYLENFLRERFALIGTPVRLLFKEGDNPYEGRRNTLTPRQMRKRRRLVRHRQRRQ